MMVLILIRNIYETLFDSILVMYKLCKCLWIIIIIATEHSYFLSITFELTSPNLGIIIHIISYWWTAIHLLILLILDWLNQCFWTLYLRISPTFSSIIHHFHSATSLLTYQYIFRWYWFGLRWFLLWYINFILLYAWILIIIVYN